MNSGTFLCPGFAPNPFLCLFLGFLLFGLFVGRLRLVASLEASPLCLEHAARIMRA